MIGVSFSKSVSKVRNNVWDGSCKTHLWTSRNWSRRSRVQKCVLQPPSHTLILTLDTQFTISHHHLSKHVSILRLRLHFTSMVAKLHLPHELPINHLLFTLQNQYLKYSSNNVAHILRGGICHSRRECKIFASSVNFSRNSAVCYINESKKLHFILISSLKLLTYY